MIRIAAAMSLLVTPFCASPLAGQSPDSNDIVVTATKATALRDLRSVLGLVDGYVARFDESFCPKVLGLDAELTRVITGRIRSNAAAVGLVAEPDCKATAVAIFIERPRDLMASLRDRRPDLFRLKGQNQTVTAMIRREKPFYAWRAVAQKTPEGRLIGQVNFAFTPASRIVAPARYDIVASYVVIDIERIVGATTTQLADFATLQLLNNTNGMNSAGTTRASILSLFEKSDPTLAPARMSDFDRGLLTGLYDLRGRALYAPAQRGRIAARIAEEENKRE